MCQITKWDRVDAILITLMIAIGIFCLISTVAIFSDPPKDKPSVEQRLDAIEKRLEAVE